ncbi:hypothetical protein J7J08_02215 [Stenotrophomonas sp. ISL-67]|uniref:hypothetical protein n=1 Tax=Stenotrophomonas sp. ISL-67 TaxID=2819171 RepID=UPI001BE6214A|nr:hypothetical protein [Stenotrophomonas sp. ISL-67]MBT2766452.1 hypothetical protein [Stenotrophomonas sp. ISL-67]
MPLSLSRPARSTPGVRQGGHSLEHVPASFRAGSLCSARGRRHALMRGHGMDNISVGTVPTGGRALRTRTALPRLPPDPQIDGRVLASELLGIANAGGLAGMPVVPVHENCVQETLADTRVGYLYVKIVKRGHLSTLNVDLGQLCRTLAGSASVGDLASDQRISNVYVGKALHILSSVVGDGSGLPCDGTLLKRAVNWCLEVLTARDEFTIENLSVIMFHLGGLINYAPVAQASGGVICRSLVGRLHQMLEEAPLQASGCPIVALGLVGALRASEIELYAYRGGTVPRLAPDVLLISLFAVLDVRPVLLANWASKTLALVAKYGVQYLSRVSAMDRRWTLKNATLPMQLNAARLLKPVIEEARRPERGVWDHRNSAYRSLSHAKEIRDYLAYATRYYCRWLAGQPEHIRARFELAEPPRGPLPDNPRDERGFAQVARLGMDVPTTETSVMDVPALPDSAVAEDVAMAAEPLSLPQLDLARFNEVADALVRQGEAADRFDREDAIAAANALVASLESGRTALTQAQRVQMLLNMDAVCQRLVAAPPQASEYAWQLSSMRGFLAAQLAQVVGSNGKPLMAADLPATPGLSSWQRSLLVILNSGAGES